MYLRFFFDPLYEEITSNTSDLMVYVISHFFYRAFFAIVYFCCCYAYSLCGLELIPISSIERERAHSLLYVKKHILE